MKKKVILIVLFLILISSLTVTVILYNKNERDKKIAEQKRIETAINNIKKHYSNNVITTIDTKLYKKDNEEYKVSGEISKDIKITLKEETIDENTKYFYIPELDSYISYNDVSPSEEKVKDDRYKYYISFNKNIKTKDSTSFYDKDGNLLYTLNKPFEFKVLVMDTDKYGVVFNDELVYIKTDDVEEVIDADNGQSNRSKIKTLFYHFLYDPQKAVCDQIICLTLDQFEAQLKYLNENDYFTLKMEELEMYLDGKINIPQKSIALTIDDATIIDEQALRLLEKYEINATAFVITGWVDLNTVSSPYLDLESHTDLMHNQYECKGMGLQGGGILCLPESKVLEDLRTSQEKLGGSKYFAYPFFDYNERAIRLLKEAGFTMAFIGQASTYGDSYPKSTDKMKIPRLGIFSDTTLDEFISYVQ